MSSVEPIMHPCKVCNEPTYLRCSRCGETYYCRREHIVADWPQHKPFCHSRKDAIDQSILRPDDLRPLTMDGILFPVDEALPRLVKVEYQVVADEDDEPPIYRQDLERWLGNSHGQVYITREGINGPVLDRTIHVVFNDMFLIDGSKLNRCLQHSTGGNMGHPWAGNILAFRSKEPLSYYAQDYDAKMEEDLKPLISYFKEYGVVKPILGGLSKKK